MTASDRYNIEAQHFFINQHGQLEIAPPHKHVKLREKGLLLRYDQLTLLQRKEAKVISEKMAAFMAKIADIQQLAKHLAQQNKYTDPRK